MTDAVRRRLPRALLALAVVGAVAAFYLFGPSESEIFARQAGWKAAVADNLLLAVFIFFIVEVILVGLSVPVATGLSVLAGFMFGRWLGTLVVSLPLSYTNCGWAVNVPAASAVPMPCSPPPASAISPP